MKKINSFLRCNKINLYEYCGIINESYFNRGKHNRGVRIFFDQMFAKN